VLASCHQVAACGSRIEDLAELPRGVLSSGKPGRPTLDGVNLADVVLQIGVVPVLRGETTGDGLWLHARDSRLGGGAPGGARQGVRRERGCVSQYAFSITRPRMLPRMATKRLPNGLR
jgi:hypothetical protein